MRIILNVLAGPHEGKHYTFDGHDTFLVGRVNDAHFQLSYDDPYFSRRHFLIEVNPPRCRLLDLKSRNGVRVNGQKVKFAELKDGDVIKAGHTVFRLNVAADQTPEGITLDLPGAAPPDELPDAPAEARTLDLPAPDPVEARTLDLPAPAVPGEARTLDLPARIAGAGIPTLANPRGIPTPETLKPADSATRSFVSVPGYKVDQEIGRGGMGVVYKAVRVTDNLQVALKLFTPATGSNRKQVERFLREARTLGALTHPNIVGFVDTGEAGEHLYLAMELVDGVDAGKLLKQKGGTLDVRTAVRIVCSALAGLSAAHAAGVVHRDIKPGNLLVGKGPPAEPGGKPARVVKIADFGLARAFEASQLSGLTMQGEVGGTPAFMAPEQVTHYRECKPPADQYSLGATLYTLLTGYFTRDFAKEIGMQLVQVMTEPPVPVQSRRPDLPDALAAVIHKAMEREPEKRYPSVAALRSALLPFAG